MTPRIVVLDGYALNPGDLSWVDFEALGELTVHDRTPADVIVERAAGHEIVLTNKAPLRAETLKELPSLAYIGVLATGYDIVDVAAAKQRGIVVTNVPTYGTDSVAQHAISMILHLMRRPAEHSAAVRDGQWTAGEDWCFALSPINELTGKTLGIVGFGRIGQAVARIGAAMGMSILAYDVRPQDAALPGINVTFTDLDDLFARADVVSLHCPVTPGATPLVDDRRLGLMRPHAVLINTSRGTLVDSKALAEALTRGQLAGAGLDVLDVEPPPANHPLLSAPNCIITPHVGWYAQEARQRLMDTAVGNLRAYLAGAPVNTL